LNNSKDTIVISGSGVACGLGLDLPTVWQNVLAGRRGIGPMPDMESALPPGSDGGQAMDLPTDFEPTLPREARYLRWALLQAIADASLQGHWPSPDRVSVMLGTTLHGMRAAGRFVRSNDYSQLNDFLAGNVIARAVHDLPIAGGMATTCSACSSSLGSIALGVTLLQSGQADVVIAGGYDPVSEYAWAGFNSLRLVSGPPLRPFVKGRCGMKVAEAYAIVILERAADVGQRGGRAFATVAGWGETADAHHLTQPHPQGQGAAAAMQQAIGRANLSALDIGLISAHATGTPDNDSAEFAAMHATFGDRLPQVPVVGFKSHLGHTLGAAGAIELLLSACALRDGLVPPTALDPSETVEFDAVSLNRTTPKHADIRATLNTSLGFGGANTSVVLTPAPSTSSLARSPGAGTMPSLRQANAQATPRPVVVTGIGLMLPGMYNRDQFRTKFGQSTSASERIDFAQVESILNARRIRRMSDYVKLTLAAATQAVRQAFGDSGVPTDTAAILGTTHGSAGFSEGYYRQLVAEGATAANPLLFAEGVPNAAAAQLSLMLGLTGACQTILGTRTAGLDALRLAMLRIQSGDWARCIVSAGEEDSSIVASAYEQCSDGRADNTAGAVALMLEAADTAAARGARVLATLTHATAASGRREDLLQTIAHTLEPLPSSRAIAPAGRIEAAALRKANRPEQSIDLQSIGQRFSTTPLAGLVALIDRGDAGIVCAADPSGLAAAVRVEAGSA
jgi:3-oxoacyl-[acyl-carrier-protein] synthase II